MRPTETLRLLACNRYSRTASLQFSGRNRRRRLFGTMIPHIGATQTVFIQTRTELPNFPLQQVRFYFSSQHDITVLPFFVIRHACNRTGFCSMYFSQFPARPFLTPHSRFWLLHATGTGSQTRRPCASAIFKTFTVWGLLFQTVTFIL